VDELLEDIVCAPASVLHYCVSFVDNS